MHPDNHNPLPSLVALAKYGIPISLATYTQNNYWAVPASSRDIFSTYYILSWAASHFQERLKEGMVERNDKRYQVIYHRTNPAEIAKHKGNIMLSFRELKEEYQVQPVVLVSLDKKS